MAARSKANGRRAHVTAGAPVRRAPEHGGAPEGAGGDGKGCFSFLEHRGSEQKLLCLFGNKCELKL